MILTWSTRYLGYTTNPPKINPSIHQTRTIMYVPISRPLARSVSFGHIIPIQLYRKRSFPSRQPRTVPYYLPTMPTTPRLRPGVSIHSSSAPEAT